MNNFFCHNRILSLVFEMAIHILFGNIMTVQLYSRKKVLDDQGVTKRCRQSLLANSALVYES
jgi:hypothetical protein